MNINEFKESLFERLDGKEIKVSMDCEETIERIHEHIEEYGEDLPCLLIYSYQTFTFFGKTFVKSIPYSYLVLNDDAPVDQAKAFAKKGNSDVQESTLAEALLIFEELNSIV